MELWRASAQELDRLQQLYQITTSDGQLHVAEQQRLKVDPSPSLAPRGQRCYGFHPSPIEISEWS